MSDVASTIIIVLLVINLIGLIVVGTRITGQSADSRGMERRLNLLEAQVQTLPTHTDLRAVGREVNQVLESVASMHGQVAAMAQTLNTVQEYLLDRETRR
jgi:hypothetical protein